jgi:hypothetical protein
MPTGLIDRVFFSFFLRMMHGWYYLPLGNTRESGVWAKTLGPTFSTTGAPRGESPYLHFCIIPRRFLGYLYGTFRSTGLKKHTHASEAIRKGGVQLSGIDDTPFAPTISWDRRMNGHQQGTGPPVPKASHHALWRHDLSRTFFFSFGYFFLYHDGW